MNLSIVVQQPTVSQFQSGHDMQFIRSGAKIKRVLVTAVALRGVAVVTNKSRFHTQRTCLQVHRILARVCAHGCS